MPAYLKQGGAIGDLQMVDGANKMLDIVAAGKSDVVLKIATESFQNSDILELVEKCDPYIGCGYYFLKNFEGQTFNQRMWLCQVTEFVFGDLPSHIYIKRVKAGN